MAFLTTCRLTAVSLLIVASLLAVVSALTAVLTAAAGAAFLVDAELCLTDVPATFAGVLPTAGLMFRDVALLAALLCVGCVSVLLLLVDGLGGTCGALAARSKLRRKEGLPVLVYIRICAWFIPGLEFLEESDELTVGLPEDLVGRVWLYFLSRELVARGSRVAGGSSICRPPRSLRRALES